MAEPSLKPAEAESTIEGVLESLDAVLAAMPDSFLEARRLITRDLGFDPSPEQLQTLLRMALDSPLSDEQQQLASSFVAVRVLADRAMRELFGRRRLRGGRVLEIAQRLPALLERARECEDRLRALLAHDGGPPAEARNFLLQVGDAMTPPREDLLTGLVLAPRLATFSTATSPDQLRRQVPGLEESEAFMVVAGLSEADATVGGPSRVAADALALRTLLQEELDRQEGEADGTAEPQHGRLRRLRVACRVIVERLGRQGAAAVTAGLDDTAEELRRIGRTLYAQQLRLSPVLRDGAGDIVEEAFADEQDGHAADETAFAAALADLHGPSCDERDDDGPPSPPPAGRRRQVLIGAALALAVISLTVHASFLLSNRGTGEATRLSEIGRGLPVSAIEPAGSILVTEVAAWSLLDETERLDRALEIGRRAADHGFEAAVLVDDRGVELARWSAKDGPQLVEPSRRP